MKITLIIPCYNEAKRLDRKACLSYTAQPDAAELLLVNDGSSDKTAALLAELSKNEGISFLDLPQNRGKAEAVRQGVLHALHGDCEAVGFWDADFATPLKEVRRFQLFLAAEEWQLVTGARIKRLGAKIERHWYRNYVGRIIATLISCMLRLPAYDTQCGAKLFRRDLAKRLFAEPFVSTWLFDVELLARAVHFYGHEAVKKMVYELPLECWEDVSGSSVSFLFIFKIPGELWKIHRRWLR
ncbi:glycosyltransferase [Desulforhopalus vacuolatus]|uniref:glycosyltransferase n=1 Tax=Desulforhopalus vacuolatus TaxID=40414 RepID=UPI001966A58D|nr:glycosyltransferase [Desulforhopalus vacuolatus]MBM9519521.1 glycosyltransferase [Desulforhopalus vacuolatus]